MNDFTISHARREIIASLNRYGDKFSELKDEIFFYSENMECFTTR